MWPLNINQSKFNDYIKTRKDFKEYKERKQ